MKRVAAVLTLALAVALAALGYAQHNGAPPDVSPAATGSDMPNITQPSGWANPDTGGAGGRSVNNGVDAEPPPAAVPAAPVDSGAALSQSSGDDNSNATSGNDANGAGWGNSDSNATGGGDNGGSDSSATSGSDTGDSDSSAIGADDSAGSDMSNGSGDGDSNASGGSDSDTASGDRGDTSTDNGGSDTSSSDSADSSGWK